MSELRNITPAEAPDPPSYFFVPSTLFRWSACMALFFASIGDAVGQELDFDYTAPWLQGELALAPHSICFDRKLVMLVTGFVVDYKMTSDGPVPTGCRMQAIGCDNDFQLTVPIERNLSVVECARMLSEER